ncbi:MAG: DUF370 domain-containing protein [Clostridia bacterium]|nr:DUF370 domain-containing protein [Clostridia bacterium]
MYLTLGKDSLVLKQDIIGIFDLDSSWQSRITRDFLSAAEKEGRVLNTAEDIPNTFLLCERDGEARVLLAQTNSKTLYKRLK